MNALWDYCWPLLALGLIIGLIAGLAYNRSNKRSVLALGMAASLAATGLWHGPIGGAATLTAQVERIARQTLVHYEMGQVKAVLDRDPRTRRLLLSGPADYVQRRELVRMLSDIPGVGQATWATAGRAIPLIAEGALATLIGNFFGLLLAYLVALHRRYNAQWEW